MLGLPRKYQHLSGRQHGFTVVELIVVVVILAILAAIAVPSFSGYIASNTEKQYQKEAYGAYQTVQTLFALEQASGRDALALDSAAGKYIDINSADNLTQSGTKKYLQLSGRDAKIQNLVFDTSDNIIQTLTVTSTDGKASMTYKADAADGRKFTVTMN